MSIRERKTNPCFSDIVGRLATLCVDYDDWEEGDQGEIESYDACAGEVKLRMEYEQCGRDYLYIDISDIHII